MAVNQEPTSASPVASKRGCGTTIIGAVVLLVLCGGLLFGATKFSDFLESKDEWASRPGTPVPSPLTSEPPDKGEGIEFGIGQLEETLAARVVRSAGVVKPTTSECGTKEIKANFTCTITYDGEVVTYKVTVDLQGKKDGWYPWEAHTDSLIVTREGVLAAVWRQYSKGTSNLRCEDGIPERARVAPNTKLAQKCYFVPTNEHPSFKDHDDLRTAQIDPIIGDGMISLPITMQ